MLLRNAYVLSSSSVILKVGKNITNVKSVLPLATQNSLNRILHQITLKYQNFSLSKNQVQYN
jgi:hypothetical protein